MKKKPVLVVIGAASITFTPKLLRDIIHHPALGGGTLRLVDIQADNLEVMARIAKKISDTLSEPWKVESFTDRKRALPGADYVLISVDVARNETWGKDWKIPADLGVRQVTGELGGPGGLFHSLRQIPLHIEMGRDIAQLAPDATVMIESNPLNRICLAMRRHTKVKQILGLCHGVEITQAHLGRVLRPKVQENLTPGDKVPWSKVKTGALGLKAEEILATAAGTNHFTWILDLRLLENGEDLYPLLRERLKNFDPTFWPLSRKLFDVYGFFPSCGDEHIGEYLPYTWELVGMEGPGTENREAGAERLWQYLRDQAKKEGPLERYEALKGGGYEEEQTQFFFEPRSWVDTLAFPIMDSIYTNKLRRMAAVNMVNNGAIANLPADVFVECPASVDSSGCRLISIGVLPRPLAAFCRRDIDLAEMTVEAAVSGSKKVILQAMLLDPVIDSITVAEKVLDAMLKANAAYLPQFS